MTRHPGEAQSSASIAWRSVALAVFGSMVAFGSVSAATIVNRTVEVKSLLITEGENEREVELEPNASLTDVCREGCVVAVKIGDEVDELDVEANETIHIDESGLTIVE